ncbi:MAG: hypothetical protein ACPL6F_02295 [Anaerolineales bacterium]
MTFKIAETLYQDIPPPEKLETIEDQMDFLARLCSAWDCSVLPDWETFQEVRKPEWRAAVDACLSKFLKQDAFS